MKKTNSKKSTKSVKTVKETAKVVAVVKSIKAPVQKQKSTLVKPNAQYTKDEVRSILKLSKGSSLSPKYYPGMGGRGKVPGTAVIAYLKNARRVKIGRRYASGTVTVVAR